MEFTGIETSGISLYSLGSSSIKLDNFTLTQIGAVAEYDGSGVGASRWDDKSGNELHGTITAGATAPTVENAPADADSGLTYEEGTFTASLTSATPPTVVPTATCNYTKIGNVVNVFIRFTNVDTSGGSGNMSITGLPFTSKNIVDASVSIPMTHQLDIPNAYVSSYIPGNGTAISFLSPTDDGSWSDVTMTAGAGRYLSLSHTYLSA
jgi:hypothetical protein